MNLILTDINIDNINNNDIKYINISNLNIKKCLGCFQCWIKTPSKCIIKDDAIGVYTNIAKAKNIMYISKIIFGSYDTKFKTMLERSIPTQQAFIRLYKNETHHIQRNVNPKNAIIIVYSDKTKISEDEKIVFKNLVKRNSYNMNFISYKIIFTNKNSLNNIVKKELIKWKI